MDRDTERELERVNKRVDKLEEEQEKQENKIYALAKDILRFWHLGVGIGLGFIVKELGLEKIIGHFL